MQILNDYIVLRLNSMQKLKKSIQKTACAGKQGAICALKAIVRFASIVFAPTCFVFWCQVGWNYTKGKARRKIVASSIKLGPFIVEALLIREHLDGEEQQASESVLASSRPNPIQIVQQNIREAYTKQYIPMELLSRLCAKKSHHVKSNPLNSSTTCVQK